MSDTGIIGWLERLIFGNRKLVMGLFALITVLLAYSARAAYLLD